MQKIMFAAAASILIAGCGNKEDTTLAASYPTTTVGTEIDDTVVTTKVKSALLADTDVKSFEFKVETRKGAVQLSGFVDNQAQVDRAIAATQAVEGVKSVENGITLKEGKATVGNAVDDGVITTKVKSALLADSSVKSFDIAIATRKGEVQLSGFVDSQAQMDQAVADARSVEGVTGIANQMSLKK